MKRLIIITLVIIGITVDTTAQSCWQKVSTVNDSYLRIVKTSSGKFLCNAADPTTGNVINALYESNDLISWTPKTTTFPSQPHLAFNIDKLGTLFLGTGHNGVYKSTNDGQSWSYANVGSGYGCGSLDVVSDTLNHIYLGVGGYLRGLHVSSDNGLNWTNKISGRDFTDIEVVNSINHVYACNTNNQIWRSTDNGSSWQQITSQPFSNNAIMIKHINAQIFVFTNNGDIYSSSNAGVTWNLYSNIPVTGFATPYANDLIFYNGSIWWVGMYQKGLWKSSDNGLTWQRSDSCLNGDFHYLFSDEQTILATTSTGIYKLSCTGPIYNGFSAGSCEEYLLPWGDTIRVSGSYTHVYQTTNGCDSIVTAQITINHGVVGDSISLSGISPFALPWGQVVMSSGYYSHLYQNINGCDSLVTAYVVVNMPADSSNHNIGINIENPQRNLHIKDAIRLEPRNTPLENPTKGDIYFDGKLNKLRVYDGLNWHNCW